MKDNNMKALVTGCAGFIGSHLTERLLKDGYEVIGIDCFRDYYPREIKERNISSFIHHKKFTLIEEDINLMTSFPDVDYVFHQAAQAGVRASWGDNFSVYTRDNIEATQKLLEFYKNKNIRRFVYASSSSVYGDTTELPMRETARVQPVSPYGVTKLAAEHLCHLYWVNYKVPTVSLRYFTVYGPRQRPDMGINKFVKAVLSGEEIEVYGDGSQTRDFTYVDDIVEANILAAKAPLDKAVGKIFNVGGGNQISVNELIKLIGNLVNCEPFVQYDGKQKGDVTDTYSDVNLAEEVLGWKVATDTKSGLLKYINSINGQRG